MYGSLTQTASDTASSVTSAVNKISNQRRGFLHAFFLCFMIDLATCIETVHRPRSQFLHVWLFQR
jgi:hypothetical protein